MVSEDEIKQIQQKVELDIVSLNDIDDIYKIEQVSFKKPWKKKYFYLLVNRNDVMFVKLIFENKIIGYFILIFEKINYIKSAHLINVAIGPSYRGQGFGKFLIYAVNKIAINEGCKIIRLEVRISNKIAIDLYKKSGFEVSKILDKYYKDEDGLLMEKYLY